MCLGTRRILPPWRRFSIRTRGTSSYVALVDRFQRKDRYPDLVTLAAAQPESGTAVEAIKVLYTPRSRAIVGGSSSRF